MVAEGGYKNMRHMSGWGVKEVSSGITLEEGVRFVPFKMAAGRNVDAIKKWLRVWVSLKLIPWLTLNQTIDLEQHGWPWNPHGWSRWRNGEMMF
jgi:hypothetical protein